MPDLSGKRALVTGAGMDIGRGIALELARGGARVAVHFAHNEENADETAAEMEGLGARYALVRGDLREVAECERVVDEAANALGGLDVLVNNAGVTREAGFLDTEEPVYDEMFDLKPRRTPRGHRLDRRLSRLRRRRVRHRAGLPRGRRHHREDGLLVGPGGPAAVTPRGSCRDVWRAGRTYDASRDGRSRSRPLRTSPVGG